MSSTNFNSNPGKEDKSENIHDQFELLNNKLNAVMFALSEFKENNEKQHTTQDSLMTTNLRITKNISMDVKKLGKVGNTPLYVYFLNLGKMMFNYFYIIFVYPIKKMFQTILDPLVCVLGFLLFLCWLLAFYYIYKHITHSEVVEKECELNPESFMCRETTRIITSKLYLILVYFIKVPLNLFFQIFNYIFAWSIKGFNYLVEDITIYIPIIKKILCDYVFHHIDYITNTITDSLKSNLTFGLWK